MNVTGRIPSRDKNLWFGIIVALFVMTLIVSNIASVKLFSLVFGDIVIDGGTILFPLSYIIGDIVTEVYGFKRAKQLIGIGFVMLIITTLILSIVQYLPPADGWSLQKSYEDIFGLVPRIVIGSLCGYLVGEITNSYIMASLKNTTNGKFLFVRTIGSTLVGALIDTVVFSTIAFAGVVQTNTLLSLIFTVYGIKVLIEVLVTPITYRVVSFLKGVVGKDHFDRDLALKDIIK